MRNLVDFYLMNVRDLVFVGLLSFQAFSQAAMAQHVAKADYRFFNGESMSVTLDENECISRFEYVALGGARTVSVDLADLCGVLLPGFDFYSETAQVQNPDGTDTFLVGREFEFAFDLDGEGRKGTYGFLVDDNACIRSVWRTENGSKKKIHDWREQCDRRESRETSKDPSLTQESGPKTRNPD